MWLLIQIQKSEQSRDAEMPTPDIKCSSKKGKALTLLRYQIFKFGSSLEVMMTTLTPVTLSYLNIALCTLFLYMLFQINVNAMIIIINGKKWRPRKFTRLIGISRAAHTQPSMSVK